MTLKPDAQLQKICNLAQLKKGDSATIMGLADADIERPEYIRARLMELGFSQGEKIAIIAESFPGRDPMAVRIGGSTFALRRLEASMIYVSQDTLSNT
ncbi:ferrous iron transport protein A [Oxalobacter vibrioformis]|uniref:Ferrous iron transport protein A n=1 Tax=Oxalobacter vibrioformis TaxID=933080 RepID=A0A9E9LX92_9BURK|nr:FeoA family protein [Oxalobacter vibrioformis]NLC24392.1 ferrous iron transport protein A [Oxalobacter sp.]WAW09172.1 ferrous iron transport protein A [Oxalobacter vibrioformis]